MGKFAEYSEVVIDTDRFVKDGVPNGSTATVLEDYRDGNYELQVFNDAGDTIGLFAAGEDDLRAAGPPSGGASSSSSGT